MPRILVVDDEPSTLSLLNTLLNTKGYDVVSALGGQKAKDLLKSETFDLMISDIRMTPINGIELLKLAHHQHRAMSVVMLTAYGTVETAIEALKLGAFDYVAKPFKVDELLITVERALEYNAALTENADLKVQLTTRYYLEDIVAESPAMRHVCDMIRRVAPTDTTILICGESGTGKELVAEAIHACSRRQDEKFLPVNCGALPEPLLESEMFGHVKGAFTGASSNKEGLFEAADGGTIFLDEIGSMPLNIQKKLLRVLQSKEIRRVGSNENVTVDARVLAATNTRLEKLIEEGTFREDLYYRLNVIPIEIKPLRERKEDILPLLYHILRQEIKEGQTPAAIDARAMAVLESYSWPGNVRELENAVKHAVAFASDNKITTDVLPEKIVAAQPSPAGDWAPESVGTPKAKSLKAFLRAKEKEYLQHALGLAKGNKEEAAKTLKISLTTLYRKLPDLHE